MDTVEITMCVYSGDHSLETLGEKFQNIYLAAVPQFQRLQIIIISNLMIIMTIIALLYKAVSRKVVERKSARDISEEVTLDMINSFKRRCLTNFLLYLQTHTYSVS